MVLLLLTGLRGGSEDVEKVAARRAGETKVQRPCDCRFHFDYLRPKAAAQRPQTCVQRS
jgi:hypothetical protein